MELKFHEDDIIIINTYGNPEHNDYIIKACASVLAIF